MARAWIRVVCHSGVFTGSCLHGSCLPQYCCLMRFQIANLIGLLCNPNRKAATGQPSIDIEAVMKWLNRAIGHFLDRRLTNLKGETQHNKTCIEGEAAPWTSVEDKDNIHETIANLSVPNRGHLCLQLTVVCQICARAR